MCFLDRLVGPPSLQQSALRPGAAGTIQPCLEPHHLLWQGTSYEEQRYTDQRPKQEERDRKRAITALERLGYHVTLKRAA